MVGVFIGIGVGPGDPELLTFKAAKALKTVDVICIPKSHINKPSMALGMIKEVLAERTNPVEIIELVFPMTKDELNNRKLWIENAAIVAKKVQKGDVAFITLGDPMLYSTFRYLYECVKETYPEIELEVIPGVTSVTAVAASSKLPLAEKDEVVTIIPSNLNPVHLEDVARHADNLVFMKCAFHIKELSTILLKAGFTENSTVALVKRCTLTEEKVLVGKLSEVKNWDITEDYFSVAIVKKSQVPIHWKQNNGHTNGCCCKHE
ncbi:precorrin-2 C(20)-methyltransferase [Candidatus Bathycorpusculum sp.]|uniref:precorrin-2 C(20)-methyltransferase n=1 Tax=Candidatus Bathycorpusculum sp. TaxID=2994959 RepID=UPI00281D19E2|nr:precorrin-2 C(20)-methyltransferase [Candidatus Termitimicrobium sp.]MCL2431572.1 precorrin-2 C(20)-methyltransferase [Candidatus Termitimicrobium sp.]